MAHKRGWRDPAKERYWRRAVKKWKKSGQSIRDFCSAEQLSEPNFYAWRRAIAERDEGRAGRRNRRRKALVNTDSAAPRQLRQPVSDPSREDFIPLQMIPCGRIEVILSSGRVVRIEPGFDRLSLRDVLTTVEGLPC